MSTSSLRHSIAHAALRAYPAAWRQRYGDELAALIEARALSPGDVIDICRGAVREQLWPSVRLADSPRRLATRAALAAGASLWLFIWLLYPLFRYQTIRFIPVEAAIRMYVEPAWLLRLWLIPLVAAVSAYAGLRSIAAPRRWFLAVATVAVSMTAGLGWIVAEQGALRVVTDGRFLFLASKLWPFAAMFVAEAMVVFVVLDRRRIGPVVNMSDVKM